MRTERLQELQHKRSSEGRLKKSEEAELRALRAYPNNPNAANLLKEEFFHDSGLLIMSEAAREALKSTRINRLSSNIHTHRQTKATELDRVDKDFELLVSATLTSPKYLELLKSIPHEDAKSQLIGLTVQYLVLHKDTTGLEKYLKTLVDDTHLIKKDKYKFNELKNSLLTNSIASRLGLTDIESVEAKNKLIEYCNENYCRNGFAYHSFNGTFEETIRETGLTINSRFWDWGELSKIAQIGDRVGVGMLLGWGLLNCQGKISVALTVDSLYRYGIASPEWLAQFVAEGFHIPVSDDKKAFYRKDYETARNNLIKMCESRMARDEKAIAAGKQYPNMLPEEKEDILALFEKYWKLLVDENSNPKVALIKRNAIDYDRPLYKNLTDFSIGGRTSSAAECVGSIIDETFMHDIQLKKDIEAKDILIVDLPNYNDIH